MGVWSGDPGGICRARARSILHPRKAPRSLHSGGMAQAQKQSTGLWGSPTTHSPGLGRPAKG